MRRGVELIEHAADRVDEAWTVAPQNRRLSILVQNDPAAERDRHAAPAGVTATAARHSLHIALFAGLAHFCIEVAGNFLPVLYPLWQESLSLSFTQIGTVTLVANLANTAPQPLFGWWAGRTSAIRLVILGVVASGVFYSLSGLSPSFPPLLAAVALGGLGSALFHPSAAAVAGGSHVGQRPRGTRMSIFSVCGNAGAALSPVVVGAAVGGFALSGTLTVGVWVVVAGPLLWWVARRAGISIPPNATKDQAGGSDHGARSNARHVATDAAALGTVVLLAGARSWFQVSLISYLPLWVTETGGSTQLAGTLLFALLASISVGSLLGGALSDRVGTGAVLLGAIGLLLPLLALLQGVSECRGTFHKFAIATTIGCCMGATFPVAIVAAQQAWPRNIGIAAGTVIGLGYLPGGLGATVVDVIADRKGLLTALDSLYWPLVVGVACALAYLIVSRTTSPRVDRPIKTGG